MSRNGNLLIAVASAFSAFFVLASAAFAQSTSANSFFGANSGGGSDVSAAQQTNPYADPSVPKGDFTADEKRMQKKYVEACSHARALISKGDKMMQDGSKRGDNKLAKKGKIFKEIGEKRLAELQANNPLGDLLDTDKGASKTQVAGTGAGVNQ